MKGNMHGMMPHSMMKKPICTSEPVTRRRQVTAPVQWEMMMKDLVATGFDAGYELGPGKVLSGIMKRVDKTAPAIVNVEV